MTRRLPLLLLWACADETPTCEGAGRLFAEPGTPSEAGFEPYAEGDDILIRDAAGQPSLRLDYEVGGLDSTRAVTVVVRLSLDGGGTEDFLASARLSCTEGEAATYRAWATPLGGLVSGQEVGLQSVFTDGDGTVAESDILLVAVDGGSETAE